MAASYKLNMLKPLNAPFHFGIESTNWCNFKCSFCPQSNLDHKNMRKSGYLSEERFKLFIDKIKEIKSGNSNISLCLDGEPLMNKSFTSLIRISNENGLFPRFSSNGRLLTEDIANILSSYRFLASIDFSSEAEIFDSIRGGKGDFKIVLENLRVLVDKAILNHCIKLEIVDISHFSGDVDAADSLKK